MKSFKEGFGLVLGLYMGARVVCFLDSLIKNYKKNTSNDEPVAETKIATAEE